MKLKTIFKNAAIWLTALTTVIGSDIAWRQMTQEKRPLTDEEIAAAQIVFGNTIDYSKVQVCYGQISSLVPKGRVQEFNNVIYAPGSDDGLHSVFIHEMTHVWQDQNRPIKDMTLEVLSLFLESPSYDVYDYTIDTNKKLTDYNIEQQGDIVEDYFGARMRLTDTRVQKTFNDRARLIKTCVMLEKIIHPSIPQRPLLETNGTAVNIKFYAPEYRSKEQPSHTASSVKFMD